jgi:hypothetical protein
METPQIDRLAWLRARDPGLSALRRAGRAAIVMPAMFALGSKVIGNPTLVASFAAFGSFAMLLLVDFGGPMRNRLQAQVALASWGRRSSVSGRWSRAPPGSPRSRWCSSGSECSSQASSAPCSRRDGGPAPRVHPPGLAARARVLDPGPACRLGPGLGRGVRRSRGSVAGAGSRSPATRGDPGLPGTGRAAAFRGCLRARRRGRPSQAEHDDAIATPTRQLRPFTGRSSPPRTARPD